MTEDEKYKDKIIRELYKLRRAKPDFSISREELRQQVSDIPDADYEYNLDRLIEDDLVEPLAVGSIEITPEGKDYCEGPSVFNQQSPSVQITNITNISIENFLVTYEQIIQQEDIPEEEKKTLIQKGKDFVANPENIATLAKWVYEYVKNNPSG